MVRRGRGLRLCLIARRPLQPSSRCYLITQSFGYYTMSEVPSTSTSSSNFESVFSAALKAYNKQTKKDIASHPLATQLKSCDSFSAILAILRTQVQTFDETQGTDERWTKWLDPTVNVLFAFSATLGNGVGVVNFETLYCLRSTLSDMRDHRYFHPQMLYLRALGSSFKLVSLFTETGILVTYIPLPLRLLRTSAQARVLSSICLTAWNTSSSDLKHI